MTVYRKFTRQTDYVVQYLGVARQHEHHTQVEVPKLKHAPVNLGRQLEEYLNDPDFEVHRRQYLAEQDVKKPGGSSSKSFGASASKKDNSFPEPSNNPFPVSNTSSSTNNKQPASQPQATKGPDPDLIDFFDSIEQNQTPMNVNPHPQQQLQQQLQQQPQQQPQQQINTMPFQQQQQQQQQPTGMPFQQNGFAPQPTGFASNSPYQQQQQQQQPTGGFMQQQPQAMQPNLTDAGFGGYTPQAGFQSNSLASIPQDSVASFPSTSPIQNAQPQSLQPMQTGMTNPFRQSMLMAQQTGMQNNPMSPAASTSALQRQSTNPFARASQQPTGSPYGQTSNSPFQQQHVQQQPEQQVVSPLQPAPTGTNPFARNTMQPVQAQPQEQQQQIPGPALAPQPTGTTNPFRQGAFVNHDTGMGWQHNQTSIGGGLDHIPTVPVFPRPAQQSPWQQ